MWNEAGLFAWWKDNMGTDMGLDVKREVRCSVSQRRSEGQMKEVKNKKSTSR